MPFGALILEVLIPRVSKQLPCERAFEIQTNQLRVHTSNHVCYQILTHQANILLL